MTDEAAAQVAVDLTNVLVHCLSFKEVIIPIEKYTKKLGKCTTDVLRIKASSLERECDTFLDQFTDTTSTRGADKDMKGLLNGNLTEFYQVYSMIMNLKQKDISKVQNHLLDTYYSKPEYKEKAKLIDFNK